MSKKNIAVLGAGKMGLGIAQLFATKGHQVKVIYVYDDKIRCDAAAVVRSNLSVLVENDVMTQQEADDAAARISFVDTIEEVADFADIVFEGIIEKLEIKQDYFAKMDAIFPVSTILATNTSAISITEIAEKSVHKEQCSHDVYSGLRFGSKPERRQDCGQYSDCAGADGKKGR